jgi:hypothetical protein
MVLSSTELADPAVRAFIRALNSHDRTALRETMTSGATMTDDGEQRVLGQWLSREVFDSNGRMDVATQSDDGHDLVAYFTNDRWGTMRTRWHFETAEGKVSHFDTGQAPDEAQA